MILFAIVMLMAALSMIQNKKSEKSAIPPNPAITIIQIFMVGVVIGLVGAGGGFLIIPALVYLARLPMKKQLARQYLLSLSIRLSDLRAILATLLLIGGSYLFSLLFQF